MSWSVVASDAVTAQPWRNGGGITRELFAWTAGEDWIVRLSVAHIARDGPFSAFPGIDRWFAVLTGAGVLLGEPAKTLRCDGEVINFAGESAPGCCLIDGETRDLNLMIRRDRATGSLRHLTGALTSLAPQSVASGGNVLRGVFSAGGGTLEPRSGAAIALPAMSLAWCAGVSATDAAAFKAATADPGNFEILCVSRSSGEA